MRGIAGPTTVWEREATNMPSMRPTKTSLPWRSRPVKAAGLVAPGCGAEVVDAFMRSSGVERQGRQRSQHPVGLRLGNATEMLHSLHYCIQCKSCEMADLPWDA